MLYVSEYKFVFSLVWSTSFLVGFLLTAIYRKCSLFYLFKINILKDILLFRNIAVYRCLVRAGLEAEPTIGQEEEETILGPSDIEDWCLDIEETIPLER